MWLRFITHLKSGLFSSYQFSFRAAIFLQSYASGWKGQTSTLIHWSVMFTSRRVARCAKQWATQSCKQQKRLKHRCESRVPSRQQKWTSVKCYVFLFSEKANSGTGNSLQVYYYLQWIQTSLLARCSRRIEGWGEQQLPAEFLCATQRDLANNGFPMLLHCKLS